MTERPLRDQRGRPEHVPLTGRPFEEVEHLVTDEDPDTALCGIDQTDVPWNQGWPVCEACRAVADGRLS